MTGRTLLVLVLHGHIPSVLGHGTWPHGANWLFEAAAESYLPFLRAMERLRAERIPVKATVGLTPVLAEQLQDERFKTGFRWYLRQRARAAREDVEVMVRGSEDGAELAERWRSFYAELREDFESRPSLDLVASFRDLADAGLIEPIASAATHGFLPLLPSDRALARQLDLGLAAHARHFGRPARGLWLPECAYRPAGRWTSPADGRTEIRVGLEDFLADRGVEYFFVETHLVAAGAGPAEYGGSSVGCDAGESPYRVHSISASSGRKVGVLARDPLSSRQVWSGKVGYPGDPRYLEFHKKRHPSGHRYWRVTDARADLGEKLPYEPAAVPEALADHATHFLSLLTGIQPTGGADPVVTAMFDLELFGHWWFEGVGFLEQVFRRLARSRAVALTASEAVAACPPKGTIQMPAGTWGRGGDFQVWWNDRTVPFWRQVSEVERRLEELEARGSRNGVPAALLGALERQALLLQSSDWPFLIDNEVSRDYAEARIRAHRESFEALAAMVETGRIDEPVFEEIGRRDSIFGPELNGGAAPPDSPSALRARSARGSGA